jgi:hypothetical protein
LPLNVLLTYLAEDSSASDSNEEESKTDNEEEEEEAEESDDDEDEDGEDDDDNTSMPTLKKKLPVKKAATLTTASPKKKPAAKKNSVDSLAEGVTSLSLGCKKWSFKTADPFFVRGPFTKAEGRFDFDYCEVDILIGTPLPQEYISAVLSPEGTHIIYKKAVPEMFGETARVKTEMGKKWRFDNSCVLSHDDTCQLIQETSKAKDKKFWCDDEDAQAIELPVRCQGMIHRTYPIYASGQMITDQKQYTMIMTCRVECHDQRNRRERKGKILVFDDGEVERIARE